MAWQPMVRCWEGLGSKEGGGGGTGKYWALRGPLVSMGHWEGLGSIEVGGHWDELGCTGKYWALRGPLVSWQPTVGHWGGLGSIEGGGGGTGMYWDVLGPVGSFGVYGALGGTGKH